jgi:hypothetical protein
MSKPKAYIARRRCDVHGCEAKHYGKGFCHKHYKRWIKGDDLYRKASKRSMADPQYFWIRASVTANARPCWNWNGVLTQSGYGVAAVIVGGVKYQRAHRLAYFFATGVHPRNCFVLHKCDNRRCVNPDHLFLGDHQTNMDDMAIKGRRAVGESAGHHVLSESDVIQIKRNLKAGIRPASLARQFNVSSGMVAHISKGRQWKHVEVDR